MLNTEDYSNEILEMYSTGIKPEEIARRLGFKYCQSVYNFLHKKGIFIPKCIEYNRKYELNQNFFKEINTEEKAYIFGFICADGHVDLKNNRVQITLAEKDKDILEKICNCLESNTIIKEIIRENPYHETERKLLTLLKIGLNSSILVKDLVNLGIKPNKTYSLDGNIVKYIPENLMRHFLRGYFDGDGNVIYGVKYSSGTKHNVNICGNLDFLLKTYQVYFPSNNKLYFEKKSRQTYIWKLSSKENVTKFLEFLYKDAKIYLNRKYEIYKYAHLKLDKLLENPEEDNQQPIISLND